MPSWISRVWQGAKGVATAWKAGRGRAADSSILGKGALGTTFDMFGMYGTRIGMGAVAGGIIGGVGADSNTPGGTMRGVAAGALIGGSAGALTSPGLWRGASKLAKRGGIWGVNRLAGDPAGAFKAARAAGMPGHRAAWESTKAGATATWDRMKWLFGTTGPAASAGGRAMKFVSRHPNLVGGGIANAAMYNMWSGIVKGEAHPRTGMQHAVAAGVAVMPMPQDRPEVRESYQVLHSSTAGLVQGLHSGRHN